MKPVVVGSAAAAEVEEAIEYYNARRPGKGDELRDEIETAVAFVGRHPKASSQYGPRYRKKKVAGFPFAVFYAEFDAYIWVSAVYHGSRKPDAWMDRTPE